MRVSVSLISAGRVFQDLSVYFVCFCFILHSCCIIVSAVGCMDLVGLKPNLQYLSSFSASTLLVGSFDP